MTKELIDLIDLYYFSLNKFKFVEELSDKELSKLYKKFATRNNPQYEFYYLTNPVVVEYERRKVESRDNKISELGL